MLQQKNIAYQLFTDYLDISHQDAKDIKSIVVSVFELKIDTNIIIVIYFRIK